MLSPFFARRPAAAFAFAFVTVLTGGAGSGCTSVQFVDIGGVVGDHVGATQGLTGGALGLDKDSDREIAH